MPQMSTLVNMTQPRIKSVNLNIDLKKKMRKIFINPYGNNINLEKSKIEHRQYVIFRVRKKGKLETTHISGYHDPEKHRTR